MAPALTLSAIGDLSIRGHWRNDRSCLTMFNSKKEPEDYIFMDEWQIIFFFFIPNIR